MKQSNKNQEPEFPPVDRDYDQIEKDLNKKILEITMEINEKYPELTEYLEEMPVTIPNEMNPEMTVKPLLAYYESLCSIVAKYKSELPDVSE